MATQLAERSADPVTVFRQTISQPAMREQIKMALPNHIPVERFERVSLTAVQQNPDLLNPQKVERRSLFGALVRAAQDGLLPDGREGAIVPFRGKAQWMPMVAGIMTKVRRSGEIANWEVAAVFEKDTFERLLGDDQRIYHKPYEDGDPGEVVGAYSIVTFKDGSKSRDYLPRWRIEKAREQNPIGKNSLMWTKFYDEGAIKTVIRHHAKRLPMSTDIEAIFARDETVAPPTGYRHDEAANDEPTPPMSRLDAIEHQIVDEPDPPAETPEIEAQAEEIEATIEEEPELPVDEQPKGRKGKAPPQPEQHPDPLRPTLRKIEDAKTLDEVRTIEDETEKDRFTLTDEQCDRLDAALAEKRAVLRAKEAVDG